MVPALILILKGLLLGVCALTIDYLFIGVVFHRFQALTPQVWRPEGPRNYAAATAVDLLFGVGFAFFFAAYRIPLGMNSVGAAVGAGLVFWALFVLPVLLAIGIFVNWHKGVWFALVVDWLVVICTVAAIAFVLI